MKNTATDSFSHVDLRRSAISLQLPYDRLPTPQAGYTQATLSELPVPWPLVLCESSDIENAARALTGCAALFFRYSGQPQIPISVAMGTGLANNSFKTMTIDVAGNYELAHLHRKITADLRNDFRDDTNDGLAPVLISYNDEHIGDVGARGASRQNAQADIHVKLMPTADGLLMAIDYNRSLFDRDTMSRLLSHLKLAIVAAGDDLSTLVAELPLFSNEEKEWFDDCGNGPIAHYPQQPVHVEFEAHAALHPQKMAVKCAHNSISYAELNEQANQVAHYLGSKGIGEGSRVVACLEPSIDVAATLLGILKAGATYVPLNPEHPVFRIEAILADTQPSLIITHSKFSDLFGSLATELMFIDTPPAALAEQPCENPDVAIAPEHIAYIYYTSGTTGEPKGVMASHANMINFIHASRDRYGITESDLMPAVASYTFSISMFELMSPLSVGGSLLLLERDHVLDAARMAETLQAVTIFHIGPSLLKNIVKYIKHEYADYSCFSGVKHASSGGDMVPPDMLTDMQDIFSQAEVFVIYGCSEISLMGCTWEAVDNPVTRTFVGKPLTNVSLLVLDDDGNSMPVGAIGDVCFGGHGVVTGYQNRPEQTAQLFFERDGTRYYRTGDRGRLDIVGNLELMGRRDFQIQLRGMRIELGEIDYHLRQAEGIRDGIVVSKGRGDGDKVLVAYYVPQEKKELDVAALRDHMAQRLPDYMVPTFYVELDALPLNHNRKVDRRALPDYVAPERPVEQSPQTETEKSLEKIWCEILHQTSVDVRDNFMSLGGDSLLAMQLMIVVEQEFGCKLDGLEILRESLAVMAKLIEHRTGKKSPDDQAAKQIANRIYPLSSFYFGRNNELYGLHQAPLEDSETVPVLICPPIGYEYTRCQYFLHLLSKNLSAANIPSLRFDFFATGDSCGRDREATFARWSNDLVEAYDELVSRTGAETVRVFSFRMNSMLAFRALREKPVDKWVCWDPVTNGQQYYEHLRRMTRDEARRLLMIRNLKLPAIGRGDEQLAGATFARDAIEELMSLSLEREDIADGADIVQIHSSDVEIVDSLAGLGHQVSVDEECGWYSTARMTSPITHKLLLESVQAELSGKRRS